MHGAFRLRRGRALRQRGDRRDLSRCGTQGFKGLQGALDASHIMIRLLVAALIAGCAARPVEAQERYVEVMVEGGERLAGRVLEMDLAHVTIDLGGEVVRVDAAELRSCSFVPEGGRGLSGVAAPPRARPRGADVRGAQNGWDAHGLLAQRIAALGRAYPWLVPAAPAQWLSLGVLLLIGAGLLVHLSVQLAGADRPQLGRSVGLGLFYLLIGLAQVALVPPQTFSLGAIVALNGALSLFLLCRLFGVSRGQALVAQSVELGLATLIYASAELVSALLRSIGLAA